MPHVLCGSTSSASLDYFKMKSDDEIDYQLPLATHRHWILCYYPWNPSRSSFKPDLVDLKERWSNSVDHFYQVDDVFFPFFFHRALLWLIFGCEVSACMTNAATSSSASIVATIYSNSIDAANIYYNTITAASTWCASLIEAAICSMFLAIPSSNYFASVSVLQPGTHLDLPSNGSRQYMFSDPKPSRSSLKPNSPIQVLRKSDPKVS